MEAQSADPGSPLSRVRAALAARSSLRDAPWPEWLAEEDDLLVFRRGDVTCVLATGDRPVSLAGWGRELLVSSRPLDPDGRLPGPGTAWLR